MLSLYDDYKLSVKFESKLKDGSTVKLLIEDLPATRRDEAFDFLMKYFISDESVRKASGLISSNEEAVKEMRELQYKYYKYAQPSILFCCPDDSSSAHPEILGLSFLQLKKSNKTRSIIDFYTHPRTKEVQQLLKVFKCYDERVAQNEFEVCYHLGELVIHREYRGLGIANELVRASKLKCYNDNVPILRAWMTAHESQKAALKNNWKILVEISKDELKTRTGVELKKVSTLKLMYTTIY